jgi:Fe-S-cluster containining protein
VDLVQIVDAALAEATRKAGTWLVCRPGCTDCCAGSFPISDSDAARLRAGLAALDGGRAERIRQRAREFSEDGFCPALDPESGLCELYEFRPITCRTFGPPLHFPGEALGVCELCFVGATAKQIAACAVVIEADDDPPGNLTVADALR